MQAILISTAPVQMCSCGAFRGICYPVVSVLSYVCLEWYSKDPHEDRILSRRKTRPVSRPGVNLFGKTHTGNQISYTRSIFHISTIALQYIS